MADRGGRPPFKPTKQQKEDASLLAAAGISEQGIADQLGICRDTLRKHFDAELTLGREREIAKNLKRLRDAADDGNVTAMKHLDVRLNGPVSGAGPAGGKKAEQRRAADTAGEGTSWGDDLQTPGGPLN